MKKLLNSPWFFILFTLACLLPLFILAAFNHPSADDFTVSYSLKMKGFWAAQVNWYLNWSGRYASTFLVSLLHPLVYKSFFLYRLYPIMLLALSWFSINHLFKNLFNTQNRNTLWAISGISTITMLSILPSMVQGFYWAPGSLIYMLGNIFTVLFVSFLLRYEQSQRTRYLPITVFSGIVAVGSNELNLLIVLFFAFIWALGKVKITSKIGFPMIATLLTLIVASALSLFSPGNSARGSVIEKTFIDKGFVINDLAFTIQKSLSHGLSDFAHWALLSPLLLLCCLAVLKHNDLKLNLNPVLHPLLIWAGIFGLYFLLYFPYYYGTGNPDSATFPARTSNVICFFLSLSLPIGILYSIKWAEIHRNKMLQLPSSPLIFRFISGSIVILILSTGNIKMALKDLRSRDFLAYNQALNARYDYIANSTSDTLAVDSLQFFPRTIYMEDVSGDPGDWKNAPYADYFGKKLIYLESPLDSSLMKPLDEQK